MRTSVLPALHPVVSVSLYDSPAEAASQQSLPGGVSAPVLAISDRLVGTYDMELEDITAEVKRDAPTEEGLAIRLAVRLWPRDLTPTYKPGQEVKFSYRGTTERLRVDEVTGPWGATFSSLDSVELVCTDRAGGRR